MLVEIADSDFRRLQTLAEPFIDTPATVITRLLDAYQTDDSHPAAKTADTLDRPYTLSDLPPLTHSKVMGGSFDRTKPDKINWDGFVRLSLIKVFDITKNIENLHRISGAHVRKGSFEENGFKYVRSRDFSYQGVSATDGIQIIGRCARELNVPFQIEFIWRDNPDAFKPGIRGVIAFP